MYRLQSLKPIYYCISSFNLEHLKGDSMGLEKMGESWYERSIREDGKIHFHRMSETEMEKRRNPPQEEKPDDIVRIDYHCCGCGEDFTHGLPRRDGDVTQADVARHFMKCGKGVDYRYVRRHEVEGN